jgi:predicted DNA-binding antitoxin AbrB/MazE fold protein
MVSLKLRYEDGKLIPLDPIPDLKEGEEIEVEWQPSPSLPPSDADDEILAMLERTQGLWADDGEEIAKFIDDAREKWDQAWQDKLSS